MAATTADLLLHHCWRGLLLLHFATAIEPSWHCQRLHRFLHYHLHDSHQLDHPVVLINYPAEFGADRWRSRPLPLDCLAICYQCSIVTFSLYFLYIDSYSLPNNTIQT